ncbi:MAG: hypothetical protein WCF17_05895 [Terracidiphilus sp.]
MTTETETPDVYNQTIQRCAAAYHRVRAELSPRAIPAEDQRNNYKAFQAFAAELPVLRNPDSFQLYIACIAQGAAIGAIDVVDLGRFCHIAQTAMSAWKLANLTVPAAQEKERAAKKKEELAQRTATPLPPKGNHPTYIEEREAALSLPDRNMQKELYKSLRLRGIPVPSEKDLRENPLVALYFCDLAANHADELPPPRDTPDPEGPRPTLEEAFLGPHQAACAAGAPELRQK